MSWVWPFSILSSERTKRPFDFADYNMLSPPFVDDCCMLFCYSLILPCSISKHTKAPKHITLFRKIPAVWVHRSTAWTSLVPCRSTILWCTPLAVLESRNQRQYCSVETSRSEGRKDSHRKRNGIVLWKCMRLWWRGCKMPTMSPKIVTFRPQRSPNLEV